MTLAPVQRKKDQVVDLIMSGFFTGKYRFGQEILVRQLIEETGISRQPVMAALSALGAAGFVTIVAQVGCRVISPSLDEVNDFYLMFSRLEGLMAELAAVRGTAAELRRLEMLNKEMATLDLSEPDLNPNHYRELNLEFHSQIHRMTRSNVLKDRQASLFAMSDFFLAETIGLTGHLPRALNEHDAILRALASRDPHVSRQAMEDHIFAIRVDVAKAIQSRVA